MEHIGKPCTQLGKSEEYILNNKGHRQGFFVPPRYLKREDILPHYFGSSLWNIYDFSRSIKPLLQYLAKELRKV